MPKYHNAVINENEYHEILRLEKVIEEPIPNIRGDNSTLKFYFREKDNHINEIHINGKMEYDILLAMIATIVVS